MEYVDSENGKVITMEKNGGNNGPNGNDNFENGYDGKKFYILKNIINSLRSDFKHLTATGKFR